MTRSLLTTLCLLSLLLIAPLSAAQDEQPPAPQFLYRDGDHLVLLNGYTGEAEELPFEVSAQDRFEWSPDGQYLITRMWDGEGLSVDYCLKLFDVDARAWLYPEPIACMVREAVFSSDSIRIAYTTLESDSETLWLYSLSSETSEELYQSQGSELNRGGISEVWWSPTGMYLTLNSLVFLGGGGLVYFVVVNPIARTHYTLQVKDAYYAVYDPPAWSEGDKWFLINLREQYVTSGSIPFTNHKGDVYLVNAETGEQHRLTYSPTVQEIDLRWTNEGKVAFTSVTEQDVSLTLEQALQVAAVPEDEMVMPEDISVLDYRPNPLFDVLIAPDTSIGAWVTHKHDDEGGSFYRLDVGDITTNRRMTFSLPLSDYQQYKESVLIGWRPSDYPYPQR